MIKKKELNFPVFSLDYAGYANEFLVGGGIYSMLIKGGGQSKAGIKNSVILYQIVNLDANLMSEFKFNASDDVPTCISSHPTKSCFIAAANCSKELIEKGENKNARFFNIKENT